MEMFLMAAALSLLGVAVSAILFAAATTRERAEQREESRAARGASPRPVPARFFTDAPVGERLVPRQALLLAIERHVRLEQAAAESFLHAPTVESLHSRTTSPLVH